MHKEIIKTIKINKIGNNNWKSIIKYYMNFYKSKANWHIENQYISNDPSVYWINISKMND